MTTPTTEQTETKQIGALNLRAEVSPDSIDAEARKFEIVWTTGARVRRETYFDGPYDEELSLEADHVRMSRLVSGSTPFVDSHRAYATDNVLGVIESASLNNKRGTAIVRFPSVGVDKRADAVFSKISERILQNVSVGYRVYKYERTEERGQVPILRALDWEPMEVSIVPIGADAGATVRSDAASTADQNACVIVTRKIQEKQPMEPKITETENKATKDEKIATAEREAVSTERARVGEIQRFGSAFGVDQTLTARHIAEGTSVEEFRKIATDAREAAHVPVVRDQGSRVEVTDDSRDKFVRGASAWLLQRAGVGSIVADAAKKTGEKADLDPGEFRGMTLLDLARRCLDDAGVKHRGMDRQALIGLALTHRGSGYSTTSNFPVLLETAMHKTLLAAYATTPDSWSRFCAIGSVSDFRPHPRYRMGTFGRLQTVNEHGEFKNQEIPDAEKESISAKTKGNIIGLSRQSIINDDMGAFSGLATMFGRAARLTVESDVFDTLKLNAGLGPVMADGNTLFHATHNNIGTGAPLTVDSIDADRVVMGLQMDQSGNEFLDLRPAILLLALGLGGKARVLNSSEFDPDHTGTFQSPNKVVGLYSDIVDSPRLSGTRRYSFASPAVAPTLEVAFLDGQQNPTLEVQNGWRIDGVEWKVRLDYGVAAVDYRGAVTNAGV